MTDKRVMTVCGPVAPETLGVTSMCDHIFHDGAGWYGKAATTAETETARLFPVRGEDKVRLDNVGILHRNTFLARDATRQDGEAAMARELALFRQAGGGAVLDASVAGNCLGGAGALRRISEQTGVHVVASAGFCAGDAWPDAPRGLDLAGCCDRLRQEAERGLGDTGVRPGCLKLLLGGLDEDGEQALRAGARVSLETGLLLVLRFMKAED
ncbi:MAG: hypothetical protein LBL26_01055, partial [Peptococcaceae bacterium]|nr:hypothetical protein [Peptococcaceae bacterium]